MPSLVCVDVSLSMCRMVQKKEKEEITARSLAIHALTHFFSLLAHNQHKHEHFALATFCHSARLVQGFGRDADSAIAHLQQMECSCRTSLSPVLSLAAEQCGTLWASGAVCRLILITDARPSTPSEQLLPQLPLPGRTILHVVCMCERADANAQQHRLLCEALVANNADRGPHEPDYLPETTVAAAQETMTAFVRRFYAPAYSVLRCGAITAAVQLCPAPRSAVEAEISIVGFIRPNELSNAPVATRHLVLPSNKSPNEDAPNLCVLLHGSIKVEGLAAICRLNENWYGALYHMPDCKRSNLTLNCFHYGLDAVPWLGKLDQLSVRPYTGETAAAGKDSSFPVGGTRMKPSYAANPTWWLEPYGLQSDVQKILRYVKKLPDRQSAFYQELNRVCQQALALGFNQLLLSLADMLDKEAMQSSVSADVKKHCAHVSVKLKENSIRFGEPLEPP